MKQYIHKANGTIETKEIQKIANSLFQPVLIIEPSVTVSSYQPKVQPKQDYSKFEI